MIPVSTVPAVLSYLLTNVTAACNADAAVLQGTDQILVKLGQPSRDNPPNMVEFGRISRRVKWESFVGGGGADALYEIYDIDLSVYSWLGYGDVSDDSSVALQVMQRAWQILGYIETVVRTDPSLGGLVDIAYPLSSDSPDPEWTEQPVGLRVAINAPIHVEATI